MLQQQTTAPATRRVKADITVQTAARLLGLSQRRLFEALRQLGLLDSDNRPARTYVRQGLVATQVSAWKHPITRQIHQYDRPMITPKGMDWLRENGVTTA